MSTGPLPSLGRIFNRSDYAAYYGYLSVIQLVMWVGCIAGMFFIAPRLAYPWGFVSAVTVGVVLLLLVSVGRLFRLDPVNYIEISGLVVFVVRAGGSTVGYTFPNVLRIEFTPREEAAYDDRERSRPSVCLTVVFREAHPAKLLVAPESAARLAQWAGSSGIPVIDHSV